MNNRLIAIALVLTSVTFAWARKGRLEPEKAMTAEEALADAEAALETGRVGDAVAESEGLKRTRGLTKDELRRLDVIIARLALFRGDYSTSERLFGKLRKGVPTDVRLIEWYARSLDGSGKGDSAFPLLVELAQKESLAEGESYWALAQLERKRGNLEAARAHAVLAQKKPIAMQSDELEKSIQTFIEELAPKKK